MLSIRLVLLAGFILPAAAADYHIDFAGGDDGRDGLTAATAWQRAPGDPAATGRVAAAKLQSGDRVLFKGGVMYRGSLALSASGEPGRPIVIDGAAWGKGRAVIHGGAAVAGWKRCASAEEAKGNPRWADIFHVDVAKPKDYKELNLSDAAAPLPVAQHPNPRDWFWQESTERFLSAPGLLTAVGGLRIEVEKGTIQNKQQPISNLLTGNQAVIDPVPGGGFTFTLEAVSTIAAVGIAVPPKNTALKDFVVLADGTEVGRFSLAKDDKGMLQRFELSAPVAATKLTFRFVSLHEGEQGNWSKLKQIAAFTAEGANVLKGTDTMHFTDLANLDQLGGKQADWFDGMTFAFHGSDNRICYLPIKGYDPATGTLLLPVFTSSQYKQTRYCLFNSVRLIDQPGEFSVEATADPQVSRIFLLPRTLVDGQPDDISRSLGSSGIVLAGASHVVVQNLILRQQTKGALDATGGKDITYRDCEVTQVNAGAAVGGSRIEGMLIERLNVHDNPGHTKGIVLHTCSKAMVRDSMLARNTSTAFVYYACSDSQVVGNTLLDHYGSHANGLTFYVGCKNIVVERNRVARGNVALTFQQGEGFIFRNNLFDGCGQSMVIGIWPSQPMKNVQFINNTIVRSNPTSDWMVGLFSNSRKIEGLVVKNNIIDGLFTDHGVFKGQTFANNLYTRIAKDQKDGLLGTDERVETDLTKIFVDPDNGDFRLRAGSPAIGAGVDAGVTEDFTGKPRPTGTIDIGAYSFRE